MALLKTIVSFAEAQGGSVNLHDLEQGADAALEESLAASSTNSILSLLERCAVGWARSNQWPRNVDD
jgi:hypothetical protein